MVEKELTQLDLQPSTLAFSNLSSRERTAIKTLQENTNIVVRPEEKGGSVVVLDRGLYKKQVLSMLSDTNVYHKLSSDPTK